MLKLSSLYLIVFCAFFLLASNLQAEKPLNLFDFQITEYEDTSFEEEDFIFEEEDFIAEELNDIHKWDLSLKIAYPINMGEKFKFLPRFDFQREHFRYFLDSDYLAKHLPRHFRSVFLGFSTIIDINESWDLETYTALGIEGDYENTSTEDMKVKASLMINYNFSEDFQVNFGGAYDTYLGEEQFIPQLGVWFMPNDWFYLNAVLPRFLEFAYTPGERWHLGAEGKMRGNFFRLSDDPEKSFIESGRVKERFALAGLFAEFRIVKHLFIRASGGMKFEHVYKYYDQEDDDLLFDGDLEDCAYFQIGLHWTVNGPFDYFE